MGPESQPRSNARPGGGACVLSWNAAATSLFGYAEAEALGQSLHELLQADDAGSEPALAARCRIYESRRDHRAPARCHAGVTMGLTILVIEDNPVNPRTGEVPEGRKSGAR